jgi:amino acid transporter
VMTTAFLLLSFVGSSVEQAYKLLLSLAVVLQLVPFLYMYAAIVLVAARREAGSSEGRYGRGTLWLAGISGFVTTAIGMCVAFVPPADESAWMFELKMALGCVGLLGVGAMFFVISSRRAASPSLSAIGPADVPEEGEAR